MISIIKSNMSKNHSKAHLMETLSKNKRIIILVAVFTLGMIIGALTVRQNSSTVIIKMLTLFNNYRDVKSQQSMLTNFCNSFFKCFAYILVSYCMGLCAVGMPMIYIIPLIRGLGLGIISGYLYSAYALQGVGYSLLMILPGAVLSLVVLILACNESILMSKDMLFLITYKNNIGEISYKMYCIRYLIFTVITMLGAFIETFFYAIFSGFFKL